MASVIRIKRSSVSGNPNTLAAGELAYSALPDNGSNGGDRLYIGIGTETSGNAANHFVIGGKYFTDLLDHTPGTLTATSALLVDADSKLDNLKVDNIDINGNTISTLDTNGNLILNPNGTGRISIANNYTIPRTDGTAGQALITNGTGTVSFTTISTTLNISGDTGTDAVSLISDTLSIAGGNGIDTAVTDNTITVSIEGSFVKDITTDTGSLTATSNGISILGGEGIDVSHASSVITIAGEDASTTNKGIASFDSGDFSTSSGVVSIKTAGVANSQLENSSVTFGSTTVSLGGTSTSIAGVTQLDVDNIRVDGNEISSTDTNGNISLNPNGTGTVDVNNSRITSVANPTQAQDAATKSYVDSVAEGLSVKPSVRAATTGNLSGTYDNGVSGVGATITLPPAATLEIDGINSWSVFDGILVKNQTNAAHNGRYYVSTIGNISADWVLTRCNKCDEPTEIPSMYVFVQEGNVYNSTGWVATVDTLPLVVGTGDIVFVQFSGAGTYLAGDALSISGSTFNVNVAASGGIEISSDALQLKSGLAGDGLTYSSGVLAVVGTTDRISVSADAIDIASTYVGQTSIVTLGTITTGTWSATTIATTRGGTGITTYATGDLLYASATDTLSKLSAGADGKVLQMNSSGVPVWGDVDGGTY